MSHDDHEYQCMNNFADKMVMTRDTLSNKRELFDLSRVRLNPIKAKPLTYCEHDVPYLV